MKNYKNIVCGLLSSNFLILLFFAGCAAEPAKPSGFIEHPEMMKKYDLLPFQKAWKDPNVKDSKYNEIMIVPGKPILGAAKNLAAPIVGGFRLMALAMAPARTAVSSSTDSPMQASVAIEGRIRDGVTKKVIATFADREKQESAIVNLKDFSAYGNLEHIVEHWVFNLTPISDISGADGM